MSGAAHRPLPPAFTSLYRLFLRASSASVLHHRKARLNVRKLWRPTFEDAGRATHRLLQQHDPLPDAERARLEDWLRVWETRMDTTLSGFVVAARSRGLSHRLTSNMAWLFNHHRMWSTTFYYAHKQPWKPHLPPDSPEYRPRLPSSKARKTEERLARQAALDLKAWGALGEVVQLAEGRDGLSFGKMTFPKKA